MFNKKLYLTLVFSITLIFSPKIAVASSDNENYLYAKEWINSLECSFEDNFVEDIVKSWELKTPNTEDLDSLLQNEQTCEEIKDWLVKFNSDQINSADPDNEQVSSDEGVDKNSSSSKKPDPSLDDENAENSDSIKDPDPSLGEEDSNSDSTKDPDSSLDDESSDSDSTKDPDSSLDDESSDSDSAKDPDSSLDDESSDSDSTKDPDFSLDDESNESDSTKDPDFSLDDENTKEEVVTPPKETSNKEKTKETKETKENNADRKPIQQNKKITTSQVASDALFYDGIRDNRVVQLKEWLAILGFPVSQNPTDHYGPQTAQAVINYQRSRGLSITGTINQSTYDRIKNEANQPLQFGMYHDDVIRLKQLLARAGFPVPGNTNHYFGTGTEQQVRAFQQEQRLSVNGIADESTWKALENLNSTILYNGVYDAKVVQLKKYLAVLGFSVPGSGNDFFGDGTEAQVKAFQSSIGLNPTGFVTQELFNELSNLANRPLREGMYRDDVIQLKINLNRLGFTVPGNNTNHFGPQTASQVRAFQRAYGLTVDGILGPATLSALNHALSEILYDGLNDPRVIILKEQLATMGFPVQGTGNDFYGTQTSRQVSAFQKKFGLPITGVADQTTQSRLNQLATGYLREGMYREDVIQLKLDLGKAGFTVPGNNTIHFGTQTDAQVKAFQRAHGLVVDGIAGPATLRKLNEVLSGPLFGKVIVVDAGHGGSDPGAVANGLQEKNLNLDIALRLQRQLEASGATVIMTRTTDVFLTLAERAAIANNANADAFVSVHNNAGGGTGTETFWHGKYSATESRNLATHLQNGMLSQIDMRNRGVKEGNFHVVRETRMASALVEVGFVDHAGDAAKLKSPAFLEDAARGIHDGFVRFFQ